ncbi:predicted protein [Nematostella vectensis]|uniref:G-protein coupled receptors family 1 profile domain-containing protein n=1 Tax=Nematostella vectensis TaxID=45351 RepID=A7RYY9_NEMVE|nr:predicted protein [Nematostella vectensis]|eukprot:XP_001635332.1 predicted protein [Nematostella vectensis]
MSNIHPNNSRVYKFNPIPAPTKAVLASLLAFSGVTGIIGNTLVLVLENRKRKAANTPSKRRAFERCLTLYFLKSLALTDLLCSIVDVPMTVVYIYADIFNKNWQCIVFHFPLFGFPIITITNLVVISLERYMAVFYPFRAPTRAFAKNLVITAWIVGGILCVVLTLAAKKRLGEASKLSRYTSKRRREIRNHTTRVDGNSSQTWRFKDTQMFVNVIFAFCIPYSVYFVYNSVKRFAALQVNYELDYVVRLLAGILGFSNSALNPIIYFSSSTLFRTDLKNMMVSRRTVVFATLSTSGIGSQRQQATQETGATDWPLTQTVCAV